MLSGCATHADLEQRQPDAQFTVASSYQAVYATTLSSMRRCLRPGTQGLFAGEVTTIDAQLYPDLGYGEIFHGMSGLAPTQFVRVHFDRAANSTLVSVTSGNPLDRGGQFWARWTQHWAVGGQGCPVTLLSVPPEA